MAAERGSSVERANWLHRNLLNSQDAKHSFLKKIKPNSFFFFFFFFFCSIIFFFFSHPVFSSCCIPVLACTIKYIFPEFPFQKFSARTDYFWRVCVNFTLANVLC